MKVQIDKAPGKRPYVLVTANELTYECEDIDEWIRHLRLAKAWLKKSRTPK